VLEILLQQTPSVSGPRFIGSAKRGLEQAVSHVLRLRGSVRVEASYVSAGVMRRLNRKFRGKDRPTDVLAFPFPERKEWARGEIFLCPEVAKKQAVLVGHSLREEVALLLVHGVLHIFGYDHERPSDQKRMFDLQECILAEARKNV